MLALYVAYAEWNLLWAICAFHVLFLEFEE